MSHPLAVLRPDTVFSGECQHCRAAGHPHRQTYRPLAPRGRSRAYAPTSDQMNVTCTRCGEPMVLFAHLGQDMLHPLIIDREDIDTSGLRAHMKAMHKPGKVRGGRVWMGPFPRETAKLPGWHYGAHWHSHQGHVHRGPWVMVRRNGRTTGQTPRPLGWYTGQEAVTRAELDRQFHQARIDAGLEHVQRLPCGCPIDADCDGRHPGALGSASGMEP